MRSMACNLQVRGVALPPPRGGGGGGGGHDSGGRRGRGCGEEGGPCRPAGLLGIATGLLRAADRTRRTNRYGMVADPSPQNCDRTEDHTADSRTAGRTTFPGGFRGAYLRRLPSYNGPGPLLTVALEEGLFYPSGSRRRAGLGPTPPGRLGSPRGLRTRG